MQSVRHSDTEDTSDNKNPTYYLSKISHNPFLNIKFNNTSTKEIERTIKSKRVKNSHGYDGITTKMLKVGAPYISTPLNYICNKSIKSGTFSGYLKYPVVKPLFKKGERENIANYRPVTLLTSFSKVFEKIIHEIFLQHIN
jgi:Notch-like protein